MKSPILLEQKRTTIIFLTLFYVVFITYDIFLQGFSAMPWLTETPNSLWYYLNYVRYTVFLLLIPVFIYLIKKNKQKYVKYIIVIAYLIISLIMDVTYYFGTDIRYSSGDFIELVLILFSPVFIKRSFFYLATLGIIFKYVLLGVILQDFIIFIPVAICLILAVITYILLHRIISYVDALKYSYHHQMEEMVKGIINTLELKDPYTKGHSKRVADYAVLLARATGKFKEDELRQFYHACLLHDIGKINIPDCILTKPGRLTDEEFEVIKTHPVVGAKAVEDVEGIGEYINVIYYHHERWDGKGYPEGLKGKKIPILARITAVADSFDAMTSTRSYRPALSYEEAYCRIIEGMGTQFDPKLEKYFNEVYPDWIKEVEQNEQEGRPLIPVTIG